MPFLLGVIILGASALGVVIAVVGLFRLQLEICLIGQLISTSAAGGITYMDADRAVALAHCASLPQLLSVHAHNLFESRKSSQNNDSVQSSR